MKNYVFLEWYDDGTAESGPSVGFCCSQQIKAVSPKDAWKKLQRRLKLEKKVYKKFLKNKNTNKIPYSFSHILQYGINNNHYCEKDWEIAEDSSDEFFCPAYENYMLTLFYK